MLSSLLLSISVGEKVLLALQGFGKVFYFIFFLLEYKLIALDQILKLLYYFIWMF